MNGLSPENHQRCRERQTFWSASKVPSSTSSERRLKRFTKYALLKVEFASPVWDLHSKKRIGLPEKIYLFAKIMVPQLKGIYSYDRKERSPRIIHTGG